jgi:hypothetical protein
LLVIFYFLVYFKALKLLIVAIGVFGCFLVFSGAFAVFFGACMILLGVFAWGVGDVVRPPLENAWAGHHMN